MRNGRRAPIAVTVLFAAVAAPAALTGQDVRIDGTGVRRPLAIELHAGWVGSEADSIEGGPVVGVALEFPLADWLMLNPSVDRRTVSGPGDEARAEWLIDFAVQAEYQVDRFTPHIGVSLGTLFDFRDDRPFREEYVVATYGAMAGVRWSLSERIGVRGGAHWRFIDGLDSGALATTAGVRWSF